MPFQPPFVPRPRSPSPATRPSSAARGYGPEHRKARARLLAAHPTCQVCGDGWSTDLHHKDRNPHNRAPGNLLAVCEACHHGVLHGSA